MGLARILLAALLVPGTLLAGEGQRGPAPGSRQGDPGNAQASPPAFALLGEPLGEGNRLELGTLFVGHPTQVLIEVQNTGGGTLELNWASSDMAVLAAAPAVLSLTGGQRGSLELTVTPAAEGAFSVTAHLVSNAAQGQMDLHLEGIALAPPSILVTPSALTSDLFVGGAQDRALTISNSGGTALNFTTQTRAQGGACPPVAAWVAGAGANALMRVVLPAGTASAVVAGLGGPWGIDVPPVGATAYATEFDAQTLSRLNTASGAREPIATFGGFPTGLAISADRTRALVSLLDTGEIASVDLGSGSISLLPGVLAGPWDVALESGESTLLVTEYLAGNLTRVDLVSGAATVIAAGLIGPAGLAIDPSGQVAYVAAADAGELLAVDLTTGSSLSVATGLGAPTGIALAGGAAYVVDSAADRLLRVELATGDVTVAAAGIGAPFGGGLELVYAECQVEFLAVAPASGSVAASGSAEVTARFDAQGQSPGDHAAEIVVRSNDPVQPEIIVPALLRVTSAPDLRVSSTQLDFGSIYLGGSVTLNLSILNDGTDVLSVSAVATTPADYTVSALPFTLQPGAAQNLAVTFSPGAAGDLPGVLTLTSNDPDAPVVAVDLVGRGLSASDIDVTPMSLSVSLARGGAGEESVLVSNVGVAALTFSVTPPSVSWVRVTPDSGSLASGEALPLTISIDTFGVSSGTYPILIEIDSNDPDEPRVWVSLAIEVSSAPHLRIAGEPIVQESAFDYTVTGAATDHLFAIVSNPAGGGSIEVVADGAFWWSDQTASVTVDGRVLGGVGHSDDYCGPAAATFALSRVLLDTLAEDGQILVRVKNSDSVAANCEVDRHTVRLSYETQGEVVAFSPTFVGTAAARTLTVHNEGGDPLEVTSISIDSAVFQPSVATLAVSPGQSAPLILTFSPPGPGAFQALLTLQTNDPDSPTVTVSISGEGVEPPEIEVSPAALNAALAAGEADLQEISIANLGYSPLHVTATLSGVPRPTLEQVRASLDRAQTSLAARIPERYDFPGGESGTSILTYGYGMYRDRGNYLRADGGIPLSYTNGAIATSYYLGPTGRYFTRKFPGLFVFVADLDDVDHFSISGVLDAGGAGSVDVTELTATVGAEHYRGFVKRVHGTSGPSVNHLVIVPDLPGISQYFSPDTSDDTHEIAGLGGASRLYYLLYAGGDGRFIDDEETQALMEAFLAALPAAWLTVAPQTATVEPGAAVALAARFDTATLIEGEYDATILVTSNDLDEPETIVPAHLQVSGTPAIRLAGEEIAVESRLSYTAASGLTEHALALPETPGGGGRLEVLAEGDYYDSIVEISAEGLPLGVLGITGDHCEPTEGTFELPAEDLAALAADGTVEVRLQNSPDTYPYCSTRRHTVRLHYASTTDSLAFGGILVGNSRTRSVRVHNDGTAPLEIVAIETDSAAFIPPPTTPIIPPGGVAELGMAFAPGQTGPIAGVLTLRSNDPLRPELTIALAGEGIAPPIGGVYPPSLAAALPTNGDEIQTFSIANTGGSPLTFQIEVLANPGIDCGPAPVYVTTTGDGGLLAIDRETGAATPVLTGLPWAGPVVLDEVKDVAYVASSDLLVEVNLTTGASRALANIGSSNTGMVLSEDRQTLYVASRTFAPYSVSALNLVTFTRQALGTGIHDVMGIGAFPDGSALLVVDDDGELHRLDLASGEVESIATGLGYPTALAISLDGTTAYVGGASGPLLAVDLATGEREPLPYGFYAPAGLAIDPIDGSLWVIDYAGGPLYRVDLDLGEVSELVSSLPAASGGIAPASGTECRPPFLAVHPSAGVVAPGEHAEIQARFDASGLGSGVYPGMIRVATNEPIAPLLQVPVTLTVSGRGPNLVLSGEEVVLESSREFAYNGTTLHEFVLSLSPAGGAVVEVVAEGAFRGAGPTVTAEGLALGHGPGTGLFCGTAVGALAIDAAALATRAADGRLEVTLTNPAPGTYCPVNRHTVRLRYNGPLDPLDFGTVFVGRSREFRLLLRNDGDAALVIGSIAADRPELTVSAGSFTLAPGEAREIAVGFHPAGAAEIQATLTVASNDPDRPAASITLLGVGRDAPRIEVEPLLLAATLPPGGTQSQSLTIRNLGAGDLHASLDLASLPGGPLPAAGPVELLSSSPVPLSCLVEDPEDGALYAHAAGVGFYRYDAATGSWERLADAPTPGASTGGGALLGRRIYTTGNSSASLREYNLETGTWRVVSTTRYATNLASDGERYLYLQSGFGVTRFDPSTLDARPLPQVPDPYYSGAGLQWFEGSLYAKRDYGPGFYRFDIAAGQWENLADGPSGAGDLAIDPVNRALATVSRKADGSHTLARYSFDHAEWSETPLPPPVSDGGLAWLPGTTPGFFSAQGQYGTGLMRVATPSHLAAFEPRSLTLPPGGEAAIQVRLDAGARPPGEYAAGIAIHSDDPDRPRVDVAVTLLVVPAPDIEVTGIATTVESEQLITALGQQTLHHLPLAVATSGSAVLDVTVLGQQYNRNESALVTVEGELRATLDLTLDNDSCASASARFSLSPDQITQFAADGDIDVLVENSPDLEPRFCSASHLLRLDYTTRIDPLDFGTVLVGGSRTLGARVWNRGTVELNVASIAATDPAFSTIASTLRIAPGASQQFEVTFRPTGAGPAHATLRLASDDPDEPVTEIDLAAIAAPPPVVSVTPSSLSAALLAGETEVQTLEIRNLGGSPLVASVVPRFGSAASVLVPFAGAGGGAPHANPVAEGALGPEDSAEGAGSEEALAVAGVAGEFEELSPSPEALRIMIEDSAGRLFGQSANSTGFYRYEASADTWLRLADAPISGSNLDGGVALLAGRIYTSYSNASTLGVYDIASDSWSTRANPQGSGDGMLASDGERYLYLLVGSQLKRLDPVSGEITLLTVPPIGYAEWGGLRYFEGAIYAHVTYPNSSFFRYDIAADSWSALPQIPGPAVVGAAIDPAGRNYVAHGGYGTSNLYRFSIDEESWTVATIPFFEVGDGGLGWIAGPVPGIYIAEGRGAGFARLITTAAFLTVDPATVTIPPGESREVAVRFDATSLASGAYQGTLEVRSNDPEVPVWSVATSLAVIGTPRLALGGAEVSATSTRPFGSGPRRTVHRFPIAALPDGDLSVDLILDGDFGYFYETAELSLEGRLLGWAGTSGVDCARSRRTFTIAAADAAVAAADGFLDFTIFNSYDVGTFCPVNQHGIRLRYTQEEPPLAFGSVPVGGFGERGFTLRNAGTSPLHVTRIATGTPAFEVSLPAVTLAVGESVGVRVAFRPDSPGELEGVVEIESDDPVTPLVSFVVSGSGAAAPHLEVEPGALSAVLRPDGRTVRGVTLRNTGAAPLAFSLHNLGAAAGVIPGGLCPPETAYLAETGWWRIRRADLAAGTSTILAGVDSPYFLALSGDRETLYVTTNSTGLVAVDTASGETRVVSPVTISALGLRLAPDGSAAYVIDPVADAIASVDLETGMPTNLVTGLGAPAGLALSPDGNIAYVTRYAGSGIARVDLRTGASTLVTQEVSVAYGIAVDAAGEFAYVAEYFGGRVARVELATGEVSTVATGLYGLGGVALDAGGTTLFVSHSGYPEGGVTAIDLATGTTRLVLSGVSTSLGLELVPSGPCAGEFAGVAPTEGVVPAGGVVTIDVALDATGLPVGRYPATLQIHSDDPAHPVVDLPVTLDVSLNLPPQAVLLAPALTECDRAGAGAVLLDGSSSLDPDSTPGTNDDIAQYEWLEDLGLPTERLLGTGPTLATVLSLGAHPVSLRVTDQAGATDTTSAVLTVQDTQLPSLVLAVTPAELWPPEHQMERIDISWVVADLCDPSPAVALVGVTSSEPDDAVGLGDGATTGDIAGASVGTADAEVELRAERAGTGGGRTYELTYRVTDASGNSISALGVVQVPRDLGQGRGGTVLKVEASAGGYRWYWSQVPEATGFDLVSGALEQVVRRPSEVNLGWVEVLGRGRVDAWLDDPAQRVPAARRCFFYVVQGRTERGGWGYGEEPLPWPRVPEACAGGCP